MKDSTKNNFKGREMSMIRKMMFLFAPTENRIQDVEIVKTLSDGRNQYRLRGLRTVSIFVFFMYLHCEQSIHIIHPINVGHILGKRESN